MGVARNATVGLSPKRRNNVLIECNSDEDSPELTLEIIQDLLLSQEESTSGNLGTGDSILNQEEAKPDGDEDDDVVSDDDDDINGNDSFESEKVDSDMD